jgi:Flp pilus assembly pilin Flp
MNHSRRSLTIVDDHGQTVAEYSTVIAVIALVAALAVPRIGQVLGGFFDAAARALGV